MGRKAVFNFKQAWSGERQVSLALETEANDVLILTLTPAKEMVVVVRVPARTVIETPWFGEYQVGKLSLLADQEKNKNIFNGSLTYYLGIPIDYPMISNSLSLDKFNESEIKKKLTGVFIPPQNFTFFKIWRYLSKKDIVWNLIDLEDYGQKDFLADDSEVFRIKPEKIDDQFWGYFSDPVVKKENLTMSVFNVGSEEGLANKISAVPENMGVRIVEVDSFEMDLEDCLIRVSKPDQIQSVTVDRLKKVLGCRVETGGADGIGDLELLINNVKI